MAEPLDDAPTAAAGAAGRGPAPRRRRYRTMRELLGSIILGFELFAIFLCALTFFGLKLVPAPVALGGGAAVLVVMVLLVWALRKPWGVAAGWVFHVAMLATGFVHGGMFFVSGLLLAVWAYSMVKGAAIDAQRAPVIAEYERALAAGEINPDGSPRDGDA